MILTPQKGRTLTAAQLSVTEQIIRNRVTGIGVSGATVQTQGNPPQVIVQVPGVESGRKLDAALVTTAQLLLRPVQCFAGPFQKPVTPKPTAKDPHPTKQKVGNPLKIPLCRPPSSSTTQNPNFVVTPQPNTVQGYTVSNVPPDPQFTNYPSITVAVNKVPLVDSVPNIARKAVIEEGLNGQPSYNFPDGRPLVGSRYVLFPAVMNGTAISSASAQQTQTGAVGRQLHAHRRKGSAQWDYCLQACTSTTTWPSSSTASSSPHR